MKELSTNANTEIRWITQTSLSLHFIMSDIFTYIRTVVSAFTQRSTNKFHQHAKIHSTAGRHLCVMFHYKAGGSTCFCPPTFSFSSIWTPALSCCVSRIQSVTAKKKKKESWSIPQTLSCSGLDQCSSSHISSVCLNIHYTLQLSLCFLME